jgi:dGTPase
MPSGIERWPAERAKRRHKYVKEDQRSPFERDRDRILYCSAFRRLAGVTQIVRANEADVFHNRLTHSLKVAQVGRRIAERLLADQPDEAMALGVDPDVVEAACLGHDLGHPPFGHIGEHTLDALVRQNDDPDGYEGNAQSFRILTKLAIRFKQGEGLDLTRATLGACLKYPWLASSKKAEVYRKWNAYTLDETDFDFARQHWGLETKTAEAEIMDWADDIAYSVHDLEDFHRCGFIPWHKIFGAQGQELVVQSALKSWRDQPPDAGGRLRDAYSQLCDLIENITNIITEPYEGYREQRREVREQRRRRSRYMLACTAILAAQFLIPSYAERRYSP